MGVTASERDVLKVISELKTANRIDISYRIGLSSNYVEYLCKYLLRRGYLGLVGKGRYVLTAQGHKVMTSLGYGLEERKLVVDRKMVKDVASEVAKEVAKEVTKGIKLREVRLYPVKEKEEEKIKIKTDYVPSVEDETAMLESNIEEIGVETEAAKSDIDKSIKLFRNIKKKKGKKTKE